jgi:nicotinamidase-related amidase
MAAMHPNDLRLDAADTLLVVIDTQERLAGAMEFKVREHVTANIRRLLALGHETALPVIVAEQYPKGLGSTLADIAADLPPGTVKIEKTAFSCLQNEEFTRALGATGRKSAVLMGMETHVCVLQTALDLLAAGHRVFVPQDAVCSRAGANWKVGLALAQQGGAVITSTETVIFQVLGRAGTPAFAAMQPWIR